ncbi:DUF5368 domain-containing protein [Suttonella sp. R2A3]|uniref:DUF5368 domain-containing protein n=1 Tax=Suttonella sp. R2A3 TaxID=2908648 RepID=UPI001F33BC4B|nr:DUF5368 domain-containing protein [Suttonella sp. R2A3]UJF23816.1 DUF5368 domain-containing protein [Suttonella sp. R2A3]
MMKSLDFASLLAVFQEMFGAWFWPMLVAIVLITVLFLVLLIKERRIHSRRLMWAQLLGIPGGILALVIMATVSSSGYTDAGGPIDWIIIALVFALGFIGTAIIYYTIVGWLTSSRRQEHVF